MAKRSLRASAEGILRAKRAFECRGWTQDYLAAEVELKTRQPIWKFFSGRPVERHIFIEICFVLDLNWEEIVDRSAFLSPSTESSDPVGSGDPGQASSEPLHAAADPPVPNDLAALRSHLAPLIQTQCHLLELPLDLRQPITLPQIYTEAYLYPYQRFGRSLTIQRLPATPAVQSHPRLLILGRPGAGKTTLLQHLALESSAGQLQGDCAEYLPVFLRLRQLALVPPGELDLQQLISQRWRALGLPQTQVDFLWQRGQLWLLLDGWDEVPPEHHPGLTQQLQTLLDTYPNLRVLVSGRHGSPTPQLNGLVAMELAEFAPHQIETYVYKWFEANHPDGGDRLALACLEALHHPESDRLREMALTPILLHLMCLVFHGSGQFPYQRSTLYQQALALLLGQWDRQRGICRRQPLPDLTAADLLRILGDVAAATFEQGKAVFDEVELLTLIAQSWATQSPQRTAPEHRWADSRAILQILIEHHGMLVEHHLGTYGFSHLSFQEFLTARRWAVTALDRDTPQAWDGLTRHLSDPHWREVILLTVEMVPQPQALLEGLFQQGQACVIDHPDLVPILSWANYQAQQVGVDRSPAALRGFYLGLWFHQGLDLAIALDARLGIDLPPPLALDQALSYLLNQAQRFLAAPELQVGFELVFALDLHHRFTLAHSLAEVIQNLQTELVEALEDEQTLACWCQERGKQWGRSLTQAVAVYHNCPIPHPLIHPAPHLETYYQTQRLLATCLHHSRALSAETVQAFEQRLLMPEVAYELA
ncbi:MAG: NACHT domain-containing protein [Synechococcales bacterium]|nr:NACHT domain-containing protein [Synechococcales bacterium]